MYQKEPQTHWTQVTISEKKQAEGIVSHEALRSFDNLYALSFSNLQAKTENL